MDAFDAMTTDRPYREAMPLEAARSILRDGSGRQWDARVVSVLLETVQGDSTGHQDNDDSASRLVVPETISQLELTN
jgi:HD-GYP domain-containing protein (c-di-GMP phosphodiesterase class II)